MSATIRPDSGDQREIGSDRSRSKTPLLMSVFSPTPVFRVAKSMFWTMMPGRPNARYSDVDPEMAPPNTYVKSTRNMIG